MVSFDACRCAAATNRSNAGIREVESMSRISDVGPIVVCHPARR